MKRIELIGPPGAGKTTLYRELRRMKPDGVLFSDDFPSVPEYSSPPKWLVEAYARCDETPETIQMRLQATSRALAEADAVGNTQAPGVALMDESVCQRCLSLMLSRPRDAHILNDYCNRVLLPAAVLLLLADSKTLEKRYASIPGRSMIYDAQFSINSCIELAGKLNEFGVHVFSIGTKSQINVVSTIAANFLTA